MQGVVLWRRAEHGGDLRPKAGVAAALALIVVGQRADDGNRRGGAEALQRQAGAVRALFAGGPFVLQQHGALGDHALGQGLVRLAVDDGRRGLFARSLQSLLQKCKPDASND